MYSRFWTMIDDRTDDDAEDATPPTSQQYSYRGMNANGTVTKLAALSIPSGREVDDNNGGEDEDSEEEQGDLVNGYIGSSGDRSAKKLVWSEPLAPVNDREDAANSQGISFPSTFCV